jgi:hypothetical protein
MTIATAFPDAPAADPSTDRENWHEPLLKALAEIGMELARGIARREAAKAVDDESGRDPQLAFARVSRAVRQTVALSAHLRQQRQAGGAGVSGEAPGDEARDEAHAQARMDQARYERVAARVRVLCRRSEVAGRLTAAIEAEAARGEAERLLSDLDRRLDVVAEEVDFAARPIEEVIDGIRLDLGLEPRVVRSRAASGGQGFDEEAADDEPGGDLAQSQPRRGSG